MCEYCGCQSLRAIEELTREHDAVLELARTGLGAAAAGDGPAAVRTADRLLELHAPHTAVEDGTLFPAMAREHPDHVEVLHREHERVHAALVRVATPGPPADGWQGVLTTALDVLRAHVYKERDGLFPGALLCLDATDWDLVEDVRARVGGTVAAVGS